MRRLLLALCLLLPAGAGLAKEALPVAEDAALEKRVMVIAETLRCLVCQNQTIADSHADLATDLKTQIREKLKGGASDQAITDYMVARYGDFVLYRPPVKSVTVLLWFGPFVLLAAAFAFLLYYIRRRREVLRNHVGLNDAERARARAILGDPGEPA